MTQETLSVLGADAEDFIWQDLSLCKDQDTKLFFDDYENSATTAKMVDEMCLSCPVMTICLRQGVDNAEWGVWGGIYLVRGKVSKDRNAHKSKKVWDEIKERIVDESIYG